LEQQLVDQQGVILSPDISDVNQRSDVFEKGNGSEQILMQCSQLIQCLGGKEFFAVNGQYKKIVPAEFLPELVVGFQVGVVFMKKTFV